MAQSWPLFRLFLSISQSNNDFRFKFHQIEKIIDGVSGTQTSGHGRRKRNHGAMMDARLTKIGQSFFL